MTKLMKECLYSLHEARNGELSVLQFNMNTVEALLNRGYVTIRTYANGDFVCLTDKGLDVEFID